MLVLLSSVMRVLESNISVTDMSQVAQLVLVVLALHAVNISSRPSPQYGGKSRLGILFYSSFVVIYDFFAQGS